MLEFFSFLVDGSPGSKFLILTASEEIAEAELRNFPAVLDKVYIKRVSHAEVPKFLSAADLGLAFIQPKFSMGAVSAIKVGEYMLCGVPAVIVDGVGSRSSRLRSTSWVLNDFSEDSLRDAVDWLLDVVMPARAKFQGLCREIGEEEFSLQAAVNSYVSALNSLS